jgi:cytochrome d ubiquinol oxidase subunit I
MMGPSGTIAVLAGWATTEVGRQPWVITGLLRTSNASSAIATPGVATSLAAFVVVYFAAFSAGTWYILKLMAIPPHENEPDNVAGPVRTAGTTPAMEGHMARIS